MLLNPRKPFDYRGPDATQQERQAAYEDFMEANALLQRYDLSID